MQDQSETAHASPPPRTQRHRPGRGLAWVLGALGLLALGAVGGILGAPYLGERFHPSATSAPTLVPAAPSPAPSETSDPAAAAEVFLAPDAITRAGITTARADLVEAQTSIELPGTVTPNAYREVKVVPIAGGIITRVHVELGTTVKRGAALATLFSPELAEAQTRYLSMRAMLAADHQKLQRTRQLVEIGAVSRQEFEDITALHTSHATEVEAARQRLFLLGLSRAHVEALISPRQVVSEITVPAPITGVITHRSANLGQVASMGQELFVVTDLSQVWVIGDLYEQDFQTLHVGSTASITTPAYPGLTLHGQVSYIDPRMEPQTRTAKIRLEVPNPQGQLRLGLYVTVTFTTRNAERLVIVPRTALQTLGARQVVFMPAADEEGKFVAQTVQVGPQRGDFVTIRQGVEPGEEVVTEGSFFLRAEMLRNAPAG